MFIWEKGIIKDRLPCEITITSDVWKLKQDYYIINDYSGFETQNGIYHGGSLATSLATVSSSC